MIKSILKISSIFILLLAAISFSACNKRSYPCPGNGTMSEKDFSLFDEEGNLKAEKGKKRKKADNGLIKKKQDDRLKNKRKRYLDDKPKNMKK